MICKFTQTMRAKNFIYLFTLVSAVLNTPSFADLPDGQAGTMKFPAGNPNLNIQVKLDEKPKPVLSPAHCFPAPPEDGMNHTSGITAQYIGSLDHNSNQFDFNLPSKKSSINYIYSGINLKGDANILEAGLQRNNVKDTYLDYWGPFLRSSPKHSGMSHGKACLNIQRPDKKLNYCIELDRSPNGFFMFKGRLIEDPNNILPTGVDDPSVQQIGPHFDFIDGGKLSMRSEYLKAEGLVVIDLIDRTDNLAQLTVTIETKNNAVLKEFLFTSQQAIHQDERPGPKICDDLKKFFSQVSSILPMKTSLRTH